jgi:hypothetical protein
MFRRTALQIMAGTLATARPQLLQGQLVALAQDPDDYQLQFFDEAQHALLERLTEMIIPADDHSLGAQAAKVGQFIDLMVAHSEKTLREQWVADLKALDEESTKRFRSSFLAGSTAQQDELMAAMAAKELNASTQLEHFFVRLKEMTVNGYYTSEIGIHQELQYKGNRPQSEFIGCTHSEHQA